MAARYVKRWLRLGTVIYEPTVCQDLVLIKKKKRMSVLTENMKTRQIVHKRDSNIDED